MEAKPIKEALLSCSIYEDNSVVSFHNRIVKCFSYIVIMVAGVLKINL